MKPKKMFKGCLILIASVFILFFIYGIYLYNTEISSNLTTKNVHTDAAKEDDSIPLDGSYCINASSDGINITLPKMTQPPYFVLKFKEPTQVFEEQTLTEADLNESYSYALNGDTKEENGKFIYCSPANHILRTCLVESMTSKEGIRTQIQGGYPFNVVMTNFGKDITEYIERIELHINIDGEDKVYTFCPSDGEVYNKILSGLLREEIQ